MLPLVALLAIWQGLPGVGASCHGFYSCFKTDLLHALDRIYTTQHYTLLPELTFERRRDALTHLADEPPPPDDPSLVDLVQRTGRLFRSHSLFWNVLPGIDLKVSEAKAGDFVLDVQRCNHKEESRTFKFGMRRMKFVLLPIMYKLGVITTLLTLLTVFALKGLTIGVLLLVMSTAGLVAKLKWFHHPPHGGVGWPSGSKEVHLHVHGGGGGYHHSSSPIHYDDPWVRQDREEWPPYHQGGPPGPGGHLHPGGYGPLRASPQSPSPNTPSPWASYIGEGSL